MTNLTQPAKSSLSFSVRDLAAATGLSYNTIYRLLNAGELRGKKVGNRTIVTARDAQRFIDSLPDYQDAKIKTNCPNGRAGMGATR